MKHKLDEQIKKEILSYFRDLQKNGYPTRIELEMREKNYNQFISDMCIFFNANKENMLKKLEEKKKDKSLYTYSDSTNKWGREYRLYYQDDGKEPEILRKLAVSPRQDRNQPYTRRLNNNEIIQYLLENGFRADNL